MSMLRNKFSLSQYVPRRTCFFFLFFWAEEKIRDLQRARGDEEHEFFFSVVFFIETQRGEFHEGSCARDAVALNFCKGTKEDFQLQREPADAERPETLA